MASLIHLLCSCCFLLTIGSVQPAKILLFPFIGGSNYLAMKRLAQELMQRKHEVTILVASAQDIKNAGNIRHASFKDPYGKGFLEKHLVRSLIDGGLKAMIFGNTSMAGVQVTLCESLLKNTALLDSFKSYDLLVADVSNFCSPILSDYLGIRRIDYFPGPPRLPVLPYVTLMSLSYVPQMITRNPSRMNFLQRVKNVGAYIVVKIAGLYFFQSPLQSLKVRMGIRPERSYLDSLLDRELTMFMADFAFEYAQPLRPDYKFVGPMNIQPVKPLPPDLQQLIDSSGDHGAIIVSFGTNVASVLDKEKVDIMAEAFGRLKQTVIWRLKGYIPSSLSPNIKAVDWLPQTDLLANDKLRVFVSHTGLNSVYETLYRGVPVLAVPIYGDQFDNSAVMQERGVALVADYKTMTADDLYEKLQRVIYEPSFKKNAQRISRLMKDRPRSPVQEAGDWIEYTLRHDSLAHLRPDTSHLSWYQYFLVDVAVFLVMVLVVVVMVIKYLVRLMCWICCRKQDKQKTQ